MSSPPSLTPDKAAAVTSWMMTCGDIGVTFTPQTPQAFTDPAHIEGSLPPWPWVHAIRGRLPDGHEITPTQQGFQLAFRPPLPAGAQIITRDEHGGVRVLHKIAALSAKPSGYTPPEWTPADC